MATSLMVTFQPLLLKKNYRLLHSHGHCHTKAAPNSSVIKNQKTLSISYRTTVNAPLHELPWASFDQYMDDKKRVLRVVFPDKGTTKQLNEEEWRIKMAPVRCLLWNIYPTADVKYTFKSNGEDYPPNIPHHVNKILELNFRRWELQGFNSFYMKPSFNLDVRVTLYPEREGKHSWLKNQTEMKISFGVSPTRAFIPESVLKDTVKLAFKTMMDEMKQELQGRLLEDYGRFKRNKSKKITI